MMKRRYTNADKTLFVAGVVFVISLWLRFSFKDSILAEGLSFCAEAALVGGVADWFAVTALFEKPFGFPYHTAILPRRRAEFIAACVNMVQLEFLNKKQLIAMVRDKSGWEKCMELFSNEKLRSYLKKQLWQQIKISIATKDWSIEKSELKEFICRFIRNVRAEEICDSLTETLQTNERDKMVIACIAEKLLPVVETEKTRAKLEKLFADYQKERTAGSFLSFFAALAMGSNIINFSEAAKLAQVQLVRLTKELAEIDSPAQRQLLQAIYAQLESVKESETTQTYLRDMGETFIASGVLEKIIDSAVDGFAERIGKEGTLPAVIDGHIQSLENVFGEIFDAEYEGFMQRLRTDEIFKGETEKLFYDLAARTALKGQELVGNVVSDVLGKMSEARINRIVREKIEPDLIWIRINGSVVGAIIGVGMFIVLNIVRSI